MPDYAAIATKVLAGLTKAGTTMTLRRTTSGTYDPATGVYTGSVDTDYTVIGLIQAQRMWASGLIGQVFFKDTLVQTDDQFVMIAADGLAIVPEPGDLLIIIGVTYTIVTMIPLRPGGVDLFYRILARK